jgi:hypothetical protein
MWSSAGAVESMPRSPGNTWPKRRNKRAHSKPDFVRQQRRMMRRGKKYGRFWNALVLEGNFNQHQIVLRSQYAY